MKVNLAQISVLTTVNKGRNFLMECVESIQNQTFEEWEHIIVSDGATEDVLEYLNGLSDPRQKIFFSNQIGRAQSLNLGISYCSTDIIAILDADDTAHPIRLERQYSIWHSLPMVAVLSSKCVHSLSRLKTIDRPIKTFEILPEALLYGSPICHSATLISKDALLTVGSYDETINKLVDLTLWKKLLINRYKIFADTSPLTYHRVHKGQSFEKNQRFKYLSSAFYIRIDLMKQLNLSKYHIYKPILTFLYGLLPVMFRLKLKNILNY